jgi:hypothetical protein
LALQTHRILTLNEHATTEIAGWTMPNYAASQGWLIVADDTLTLTTAGLAAA